MCSDVLNVNKYWQKKQPQPFNLIIIWTEKEPTSFFFFYCTINESMMNNYYHNSGSMIHQLFCASVAGYSLSKMKKKNKFIIGLSFNIYMMNTICWYLCVCIEGQYTSTYITYVEANVFFPLFHHLLIYISINVRSKTLYKSVYIYIEE